MRRIYFDTFQDKERIGIEDGMLRLQKTLRIYKNFGKSFHEVRSEAFNNYIIILVSLIGKETPDFDTALAEFYSNIYELSTVYEWQDVALPIAIKAHSYIVAQKLTNLLRWIILAKFQDRIYTARLLIGMRETITDNKRKRSKSPPGRRVKSSSGSNNLSITCNLFIIGDCNWVYCERVHKCKKWRSKDHWLSGCTKGQKSWRLGAEGTETTKKVVDVVEIASLANKNSLHQFICVFSYLSAPPRPNIAIRFRLADASKLLLTNSPSPLRSSALADLLLKYSGVLRIHLPMILRFGTELGYEGPLDAFILLDNLASALKDPPIIDKKLTKDLALGRVVEVEKLIPPSTSSPLGLVPKHDGGWRKIHHFLHLRGEPVNDHISDGEKKLRYMRFHEVLELVIQAGRDSIILKRDVKDAFWNIPLTLHYQWLIGFTWCRKFYKETFLFFGLATAHFIFNLFAEVLHWIIVSFLRWVICHYLDEIIAVFKAKKAFTERIKAEAKAYICLTDLLGMPRNDSKNHEGKIVEVFGIEVDTSKFTARLPKEKLEKAKNTTNKILGRKSVSFINILLVVGFFLFCSQAVLLGRVFMRRLWDFINHYLRSTPRSTLRRIPELVREDLEWWNKLLPTHNRIFFFDTTNRQTQSLYTDMCLYDFGGFYFKGTESWMFYKESLFWLTKRWERIRMILVSTCMRSKQSS